MERQRRFVICALCGLLALGAWFPRGASGQERSFFYQQIVTASTSGASQFAHPTSIALAPDGRLFFAQQNGKIHYVTLDSNLQVVGSVGLIDTIYNMGSTTGGRLVTGIAFGPMATCSCRTVTGATTMPASTRLPGP